jgi:hypothetical protein
MGLQRYRRQSKTSVIRELQIQLIDLYLSVGRVQLSGKHHFLRMRRLWYVVWMMGQYSYGHCERSLLGFMWWRAISLALESGWKTFLKILFIPNRKRIVCIGKV